MIAIGEYVKPKSAEEAYALLSGRKDASIVGGGLFLRQGSRKIGLAIDLSEAALNYIMETEDTIEIGAMVTFGDIERSALLKKHFSGVLPAAVSGIVGTQFRNMATVGGSVYSRIGFSEFITCLLVLECSVALHGKGEVSLKDFLKQDIKSKDILEKIVLRKEDLCASYQPFKNTYGSLPILSVAASKGERGYAIAVGARPGVAQQAYGAMEFLADKEVKTDTIEQAAEMASDELIFGSDRRASKEYRKQLAKTLVKRALAEVVK
jgi:CO/xanthine dehydrogenase FAD-binding subunit